MGKLGAGIFGGIVGAGIGATIAFFLTKKKYKDIADMEIDSVKASYRKYFKTAIEEDEKRSDTQENQYVQAVTNYGPTPFDEARNESATTPMYEEIAEENFEDYNDEYPIDEVGIDSRGNVYGLTKTALSKAMGMDVPELLERFKSSGTKTIRILNNMTERITILTYEDEVE